MKKDKIVKKFASWHLWLNLLGMAALVVAILCALKWGLLRYTHHGEGIEVPDLYGMDYNKAVDMVEKRGLRIEATDSTYNKKMPAGCVVVQSPGKGMKVKEGRIVYVTINSLTIPRVKIPPIIGTTSYRDAQARLQRLDLRLLPPKLIYGDKDLVYGIMLDGQKLRAGDMVAVESQLTLIIGNGSYDTDDEYPGQPVVIDDITNIDNSDDDDDDINIDDDGIQTIDPSMIVPVE